MLYRTLGGLAVLASVMVSVTAHAQDDPPSALDAVLSHHSIEFRPHYVVFDPRTRSTTLTLINHGDRPTTVELKIQFSYTLWPHGLPWDTTLFTTHYQTLLPHDTTVVSPQMSDPSAGAWISGLPATVTLQPHQTQQFTLRITPPATVPVREYWAKVVGVVSPPKRKNNPGAPKDAKTIYTLPIRGDTPAPIRDSAMVVYRPSGVTMGIAIAGAAAAALDARDEYNHPPVGCPCRRVWYRIPVKLTGNAPFTGTLHVRYQDAHTGTVIGTQDWEMTLYRNTVLHGWSEWHPSYPPGSYLLVATFDNAHTDVPKDRKLPMPSVADTVPFEVTKW